MGLIGDLFSGVKAAGNAFMSEAKIADKTKSAQKATATGIRVTGMEIAKIADKVAKFVDSKKQVAA